MVFIFSRDKLVLLHCKKDYHLFFNLIFNLGKSSSTEKNTFLYNLTTLQFVSHMDERLNKALK